MNAYYLTLVLRADLDEKARKALSDKVINRLINGKENPGKVLKEDLWGVRPLAYPLKRQNKGYFAHYEIETESKSAYGLDKFLQLEEDILRYLLIKR